MLMTHIIDCILIFQEDYGFYKNLLKEFCHREDLSMPEYKTIKSGASHMPTFFCTVEVEGEVFYGKAGKSKKVAEIKAAKVAYTALIERMLLFFYGILPMVFSKLQLQSFYISLLFYFLFFFFLLFLGAYFVQLSNCLLGIFFASSSGCNF